MVHIRLPQSALTLKQLFYCGARTCIQAQSKLVSSVCSQNVTACFKLASVVNHLPAKCFLRCPKIRRSLCLATANLTFVWWRQEVYGPPYVRSWSRAQWFPFLGIPRGTWLSLPSFPNKYSLHLTERAKAVRTTAAVQLHNVLTWPRARPMSVTWLCLLRSLKSEKHSLLCWLLWRQLDLAEFISETLRK